MLLAALGSPAWAGSVAYSYDTLGRLTQASYATGLVIAYAYDVAGNRLSSVVTGASAAAPAMSAPAPATLASRTAVPVSSATNLNAPSAGPMPLPTAGEDPAVYGWNPDSDRPQSAVETVFTGDGADHLLHLQGYAITTPNTVGLWLNGTLLGYLPPASEGALSTPSLWLLPAVLQVPGENRVTLAPSTEGLVWGVTRLGLFPLGSVWGNQRGLPGGDLSHADGIELHLPGPVPGPGAGYLVELAGWDADSDGEIALAFNGAPLIGLPLGGNGAWGPAYRLWLTQEAQADVDNRLSIVNHFGHLEPWGVRIDRILPAQTAPDDAWGIRAGGAK